MPSIAACLGGRGHKGAAGEGCLFPHIRSRAGLPRQEMGAQRLRVDSVKAWGQPRRVTKEENMSGGGRLLCAKWVG